MTRQMVINKQCNVSLVL